LCGAYSNLFTGAGALKRFGGESGGTSVEHALLAVLVALVCLFAFDALGTNLGKLFGNATIPNATMTKP
jgi:Flp pilus assembly pilin Flp